MNLTEFSSKELRVIAAAIDNQIGDINEQMRLANHYLVKGMANVVTSKNSSELSVLREFNVQLLTALETVKQREIIQNT